MWVPLRVESWSGVRVAEAVVETAVGSATSRWVPAPTATPVASSTTYSASTTGLPPERLSSRVAVSVTGSWPVGGWVGAVRVRADAFGPVESVDAGSACVSRVVIIPPKASRAAAEPAD